MSNPKVLISIVNWMNYWDTIECISLCKQQEYKNIEILIIDNASQNESVKMINNAYHDITVLKLSTNKGFAGGHKIAYKYAKKNNFDAIWLLNPDAKIFNDTITCLVNAYQRNGVAIYGSIVIDKEGKNISTNIQSKGIKGFRYSIKPNNDELLLQTDYVEGSSFFIPIEIVKKIGFISTRYFMYVEEVDFSYKAYNNGFLSYYVLDSKIEHEGEKSFKVSNKLNNVKTYYKTRNFLLFSLKIGQYSRKIIRINNGGLRFIIKNAFQKENIELRYKSLAVLHAYLGIMGKIVNPNSYL